MEIGLIVVVIGWCSLPC